MKLKRFAIIVGTGLLLAGFQNCQQARMSSSPDAMSKAGQVTPIIQNDPEEVDGSVVQTGNGDPLVPPPVIPLPAPGATPDAPVIPLDPPGGKCKINCVSENPPAPGAPGSPGSPVVDSGGGNVCILQGPGKSVKLGQNPDAVPGGQHKIPGVLCMSARACLEIASQAFEVKGPEFRGYCKTPHGNPHVFHVTDAQLQVKIDDYLTN